MIRRVGVPVCLVGLAWVLSSVAQDSKAPPKPVDPVAETTPVSPLDAVVEAELADRKRQDQTVAKLREPSDAHFSDNSLKDVAAFLANESKVRIRLEVVDFAHVELPITMSLTRQPLSHVLHRAMQSSELAWTVHRGDIVITTINRLSQMLETRVYNVGGLQQLSANRVIIPRQPAAPPSGGFFSPGFASSPSVPEDSIISLIEEAIDSPWRNRDGEGGTISRLGNQLVIRQTYHAHEQIARLLQGLKAALERKPGAPALWVIAPDDAQRWHRVQKGLRRELDLNFVEISLDEFASFLAEQTKLEIFVDHAALKAEKVADNVVLNLANGRYVVQEGMRQALDAYHLAAVVDDGAVRITTAQAAGQIQQTVIYDVADLNRTAGENDNLMATVTESTSGPWMVTDGSGGTLSEFPGGLFVIRQTDAVHKQITLLLHELRQAQKDAPQEAAQRLPNDIETRFVKAKSKDEAEALERLILSFVAPNTWDVSGGRGLLRTAEDRLIIQQTKTVHDQIDQFLREYQQAKPIGTAK